ncbi:MAG: IS982 family transposase [Candidatus Poribacteria bacterium]|nr:IS982 family transposase [Candidatus Poribacteria bacterium]
MDILTLFCEIDDFFLAYERWQATHWVPKDTPPETRGHPRQPHPSEVMTILIAFHQSGYRTFKHFYQRHVWGQWRTAFANLVSYTRFVHLKQDVLTLLTHYLAARLGECSGISFVDSTRLRVCDNKRISSHKVFAGKAERGKTSLGWFYGFKLHLVINDTGDLLDVVLTPGNTDDRKPLCGMEPDGQFHDTLYGDRGYISEDLPEKIRKQEVNLVYKVRKNMDPLDLSVSEEVLLKKRMLIESVFGVLKTQMRLEHSRHRSYENFQVKVASALIAYQLSENKPSLNFDELQQSKDLPMSIND